MTTVPTFTSPAAANLAPHLNSPEAVIASREELLHDLLSPADYAHVKETGLDKLFQLDPETGRDALRHIFKGELIGERRTPSGHHHRDQTEKANPLTSIDEVVDRAGNPIPRPLMEPYRAFVTVDGQEKARNLFNKATGKMESVRGMNSMWPDEYDPYMIMNTIKRVVENSDEKQDVIQKKGDKWYYNLIGKVPLIDGTSEMAVKVHLDFDTMTVITAYPLPNQTDNLNLTPEQADHHARYGHVVGELAVGAQQGVNHE